MWGNVEVEWYLYGNKEYWLKIANNGKFAKNGIKWEIFS